MSFINRMLWRFLMYEVDEGLDAGYGYPISHGWQPLSSRIRRKQNAEEYEQVSF